MADINATIIGSANLRLRMFGRIWYVPAWYLNIASTDFTSGDRVLATNFQTYTSPTLRNVIMGRFNSAETISNVNINQTLSDTIDGNNYIFERTGADSCRYTDIPPHIGSTTWSSSAYNNQQVGFNDIWVTSDGKYYGGYMTVGNFASISLGDEVSFAGYLPLISRTHNPSSAYMNSNPNVFLNDALVGDDPYAGGGSSDVGGGGGSFDDSGDDIPIPNLPALSAANAGFITLFNPSVSQLNSLADYMWTDAAFDVANFKKIFEDPMDCILGLSIVPISVTTSGSADVAIGNLLIPSIQFPVVSSQYQEFNCGSIPLTTPFFGGYLDYEPYTKIQIVVPYCGTFQISADDVIGKTINLVYHIDVLTGSCVAMLKCDNSVLYQFNGSCAVNIPINSINYASTIENATRIAVAIGTTVATAGAAAPAIMAGGEAAGAASATLFNSAMNTAGATAEGALSMKPSIERSGALSSSSGMMSVQTPYIVITRPRLCLPRDQDKLKGYPSFITVTLGDLTGQGYTEFDSVILSGLFLTDEEKGELDNILRSGVYL